MELFQIDVGSRGMIFVCNICNKGFDEEDNFQTHMKDILEKIVSTKEWTKCRDMKCGFCNECLISKCEQGLLRGPSR